MVHRSIIQKGFTLLIKSPTVESKGVPSKCREVPLYIPRDAKIKFGELLRC